jgi:hypothetical protein
MKLLITTLGLAVLAYACQKKFTSAQKEGEKDAGSMQSFLSGNQGAVQSFTANTSNYIFINTEKRNSIVLPDNAFIKKNNAPMTGSINVEMKEITTAGEMVLNNGPKQSHGYHLFPAVDFLFVSLIMVN